ncbi:MAG: peptidoglycan DD-metalloendopeptidase family protein [Methylococcaceae bacterium]|jgi:septal ring factor EnvC (AmiA/AmiB activator)|nr:peptidoglycan DD-metalloendopeptidase family protein [Methylococcaceae bacterium]MDD1640575.1 peptidoglycan DD-metalloendopeptidase family protein [Methylococcaceae bacterium]OYV22982.1 MAG: peptidase M23 [Methylococcaceae bacterium NSO1]
MRKKLIFCFLFGALVSYGHAEDLQTSNELNKVESDISEVKQDMQRLSQQKDNLLNLLADIEKHYGEIAALLKTLQIQIEQKRQSLDNIRQDMQVYQKEIDKLSKELAGQIRAAYAMGQKEKLKLLLNQQDPALSSRMMVYFNYFNKERLKKLTEIEAAVQRLDQLDKQKKTETELLEQNLEQKKSEQAALDEARKQRNELLVQIGNDFSSSEQQLTQLQESQNRLKSLMASLPITEEELAVDAEQAKELSSPIENSSELKSDFSTLKGKLPWPVRGRLSQKFGSPRSEGTWDGVLIDASEGMEIKAVTRGKVVYAEWLRGYGLLTIIDHGQGYMSLYAFNQSLYKRIGDTVEAGDVIASVGQSGGRSQAGLYFGIRKKGVPIDPLEWCR